MPKRLSDGCYFSAPTLDPTVDRCGPCGADVGPMMACAEVSRVCGAQGLGVIDAVRQLESRERIIANARRFRALHGKA